MALQALRAEVGRDYAEISAENLANALRKDFNAFQLRFDSLEKDLRDGTFDSNRAEKLVTPVKEALAVLERRVSTLGEELSVALEDSMKAREEFHRALLILEAYRSASRELLEAQRDSMSRQLELLDRILSGIPPAPVGQAGN